MRSLAFKTVVAAALVAIPMVGAQAATTRDRHVAPASAAAIVAQADAAFKQISLDRYHRKLSSEDYRWLKDEVHNVRNAALQQNNAEVCICEAEPQKRHRHFFESISSL